jgi:hypothetical protein
MITHIHSGGVVLFSSFCKSLFSTDHATRKALARLFAFFDEEHTIHYNHFATMPNLALKCKCH